MHSVYYTSDSLWKIWLVESIQSIHKSLWTWHHKCITAADITFIMSSSTSAWLLSPLECSPQKQNGWTLRFCFWGWTMWKMYNKTIIEFGFRMISWIIKPSCLCYLPQPSDSADNTDLGFDNSWYHAQPHSIIVYSNMAPRLSGQNCNFFKVSFVSQFPKETWIQRKQRQI